MLDPLLAFSLAGTVLEFARFDSTLFKDGRELYKSTQGALSANEQITLVTGDLKGLLVKLKDGYGDHTLLSMLSISEETEGSLWEITTLAEGIAQELLVRLEGLKVKADKSRKWESVWKAVQNAWTKDEIASLVQKLATLMESVHTNVLFSILDTIHKASLENSRRFDKLDSQSQLMVSSLLENEARTTKIPGASDEIQDGIETLLELVRRLDRVETNKHREIRAAISKNQVGDHRAQMGDVHENTARFEMLDVSVEEETRVRNRVFEAIKGNLAYASMTDRYEDIGDAYHETFDWVFENPTTEQLPWSDFSAWLKSGSGICRVSGKAGSGKSTLMKHIVNDDRTKRFLAWWAAGRYHKQKRVPRCMMKYFFWNNRRLKKVSLAVGESNMQQESNVATHR